MHIELMHSVVSDERQGFYPVERAHMHICKTTRNGARETNQDTSRVHQPTSECAVILDARRRSRSMDATTSLEYPSGLDK